MTALARLQRAFAEHILGEGEPTPPQIMPSAKADMDTLLGVYRHAYAARLVEVLGNDFPALKALVGAERFAELAQSYIKRNPSHGFSVRSVGNRLASFLGSASPWRERPALADMAAFEWALAHAFDAADAEPIGFAQIAAVPSPAWPSLVLRFHPSVVIVALKTAVPDAWLVHQAGGIPTEPTSVPCSVLIWRAGLDPRFRVLEEDETIALGIATGGGDFASLCQVLAEQEREEQAAFRAAGLMRAWVDTGLVIDVSHDRAMST